MYILKALPKIKRTQEKLKYNSFTIRSVGNTVYMTIGEYINPKPKYKRIKDPNRINTQGIRKELLEYHYGIYRMFPCGKQFQYHMAYLHVPGVTERSIR